MGDPRNVAPVHGASVGHLVVPPQRGAGRLDALAGGILGGLPAASLGPDPCQAHEADSMSLASCPASF